MPVEWRRVTGAVGVVVVDVVDVEGTLAAGRVGSSSGVELVDLRLRPREGYLLVVALFAGEVVEGVGGVRKGAAAIGCWCWVGMVASMTWGVWKRGDWLLIGMARSMGLMAGLMEGFCGEQSKGWHVKRFSGSGESSVLSQAVHLSVAGKPKELAESAGESGDRGEAAESDVKSVPKSSAGSKIEMGEKSEYV